MKIFYTSWLIEDQSVKLNVLENKTCLLLPKESQLNKENKLIVRTGRKENKEYHYVIINENKITESVNAINNDLSKFKESFREDFRTFEKSSFTEINIFRQQLLTSYATDNVNESNVNKSNNSGRLIILLEEYITFHKEK